MDKQSAYSTTNTVDLEPNGREHNEAISIADPKREVGTHSLPKSESSIATDSNPFSNSAQDIPHEGLLQEIIPAIDSKKSLHIDQGEEIEKMEAYCSNHPNKANATTEEECFLEQKLGSPLNVGVGSTNPRLINNTVSSQGENLLVTNHRNSSQIKYDYDYVTENSHSQELKIECGIEANVKTYEIGNDYSLPEGRDSNVRLYEEKTGVHPNKEGVDKMLKASENHSKESGINLISGFVEKGQSTNVDIFLRNKELGASQNDDDLVSTKAAMAMAAVAVAASANNTSPSAAAEAARLLAPDLVPEAISSHSEDLKTVLLSAVKTQMFKRTNSSLKCSSDSDEEYGESPGKRVQQRLALGENDAFLQYMLLLQYFRVEDESVQGVVNGEFNNSTSRTAIGNEPMIQSKASASCEKVRSMLRMAEDAYDAMKSLLPCSSIDEEMDVSDADSEYYGIDAPAFVPDLLPPCIAIHGDATHQFFRSCAGEQNEKDTNKRIISSISTPAIVETADTVRCEVSSIDAISPVTAPITTEPQKTAASVFTSMFSSMTRGGRTPPSRSSATLASVFRKRNRLNDSPENTDSTNESNADHQLSQGEYSVSIDREMLGLTVENVLERTVVRTVLPGGAAKKAGAKIGSLIVKVGNKETKNLTHFETIDELRQSQRPLKLVLRQITSEALRSAREEMGRLIRGGGFGTSTPIDQSEGKDFDSSTPRFKRTHHGKPSNVEAFSQVLHKRWNKSEIVDANKKHEALVDAGEKLVWILTLLVVGLEREASKGSIIQNNEKSFDSSPSRRSQLFHEVENYGEASKSVSKVLHDFVSFKLLTEIIPDKCVENSNMGSVSGMNISNRVRRSMPGAIPGAARPEEKARIQNTTNANTSLLLRIGDVLHRTTTFLADPASPPAALLRGEVISFLCDILDIDAEMELSEEEAGSSATGSKLVPVNDLGSAGSLLKLIILNCLMMRSPGCKVATSMSISSDFDLEQEQFRRFGRKHTTGVDLHRFHAGNRFLAVVHRLAASRSTSARVTACSLGPVLWGHLDFPHQLQLRGVITRALHDVDIVVRKSTAAVLHAIAELVFDSRAVHWLVLMCERAMTDPEPQLRAAAMTLTYHLCEHLPNAFLGDASEGSRSLCRLPPRSDPTFQQVYLLQCKLLPVATRLAEDRAPSVRLAVAAQSDRLCNALGEHWHSVIIDVLQALLIDSDEAVRGEAILCVPRLAEIVLVSSFSDKAGVAVLEALLPVLIKLLNDPSPSVRVALATSAGDLLTLLVGLESFHEISQRPSNVQISEVAENARTNKAHVDETLIPLLQKLLHDNEPEVTSAALRAVTNASRGNVREIRARQNSRMLEDDSMSLSSYQSHTSLEKVDPVFIPVLSEEQVMRLIPTLSDLANSRQWRMRQGAVEIVPALLGCTTKLEIRSEVAQLCFRLMNDHVDAVRRTAAECLCLSGGGFGSSGEESSSEWVKTIVIPHARNCSQSNDSKQRILCLKMIEVILMNGLCSLKKKFVLGQQSAVTYRELFNIANSLASDSIPNVRLNFGRVVCSLIPILDDEELSIWTKAVQEQIEKEENQVNGGDRDVLYFARRALFRSKERDDMSLPSIYDGS